MKTTLTTRQQELLTKARDAIASEPESYDQVTYGAGTITCATPACVAGHIVASSKELQEELTIRMAELNNTVMTTEERYAAAIFDVATNALNRWPPLFVALWPTEWLRKVDMKPNEGQDTDGEIIPTASQAVGVLDGILDGRITDAV